jgi:hypothetical protein
MTIAATDLVHIKNTLKKGMTQYDTLGKFSIFVTFNGVQKRYNGDTLFPATTTADGYVQFSDIDCSVDGMYLYYITYDGNADLDVNATTLTKLISGSFRKVTSPVSNLIVI